MVFKENYQIGLIANVKMEETFKIQKIQALISEEEKKMDEIYLQIGKVYVKSQIQDAEEIIEEMIQKILDSEKRVEKYRKEISNLEETLTCPKCGEKSKENAMFCFRCGASLKSG